MREARGRLRQAMGGQEVADDRVAALASLTYKSARDAWQQVVEREPDPEGDDDDEG
jgi:cobalamin biosynthesis protein CbiG